MSITTIPDPRAPRSHAPELGIEVTRPEHLRLNASDLTLDQGAPGYTANDGVTVSRHELTELLRRARIDRDHLRKIRDGIAGVL